MSIDPTNTTLSTTCANYYTSANGTHNPQNPLLLRPNDTTVDNQLYNFVTVTQGPRANISNFENCFNTWECSEVFYNQDCYMDMQNSAIASENDYRQIVECLDSYELAYQVFFNGSDPLSSGTGRIVRGTAGWKAVLVTLVVAVGFLGMAL